MELKELKTNLEKRLVEIEQKVQNVKDVLEQQEVPSQALENVYENLNKKKEEILLHYDQIEAMDNEVEVRMPELQKNVYNSLESFDSAYTKAGALMEEIKFGSGGHSTDFKNPFKTK